MKIIDIAIKDLTRSMRSMFFIGMTLAAPLLISGLMYFAFGSMSSGGNASMAPIKVGLVNADKLPAKAQIKAALGSNIHDMFFDKGVKSWITVSNYADETTARAALNTQKIGVAVLIPQTFTEDYLAGKKGTVITVLQDPTLTIGPTVVREMITSLLDGVAGSGIALEVVSQRMDANGKKIDPANIPTLLEQYVSWYTNFQQTLLSQPEKTALVVTSPAASGESKSTNTLQAMMGLVMVGQIIFFSFFTGAYSMQSILQEVEENTLARMFTTPTNRTTILAGKFLAVFITVLIQGVVLLGAGHYLFQINWGEPGPVALSLLGQMFASVGLAVLLVSFIKTSKQAGPVFGGGLTVVGMLSGLFTANIPMPEAFNAMGNFTPQGWVLKAWKLTLAGQPSKELLLPFMVLIAMGLVMFVIGAVMFKKRFA